MELFQCPEFTISLPDNCVEASTYCFVLPSKGFFRPSIVVKWDSLEEGMTLAEYVVRQCQQIEKQLAGFVYIDKSPKLENGNRIRVIFEWGTGERRFRQRQVYSRQQSKVYIITATELASLAGEHEKDLERIISSFRPNVVLS